MNGGIVLFILQALIFSLIGGIVALLLAPIGETPNVDPLAAGMVLTDTWSGCEFATTGRAFSGGLEVHSIRNAEGIQQGCTDPELTYVVKGVDF